MEHWVDVVDGQIIGGIDSDKNCCCHQGERDDDVHHFIVTDGKHVDGLMG